MTEFNINWNKKENVRIIEGKSHVFHCHHYNCFLQRTIEGPKEIDGKKILVDSARQTAYEQFTKAFLDHKELTDAKSKLDFASELFKIAGFGIVDFSRIKETGGKVLCPTSHYAKGWLSKWGKRDTACCHFNTGWIAGVLAATYGKKEDGYKVTETTCEAVTGGIKAVFFKVKGCQYKVEVN